MRLVRVFSALLLFGASAGWASDKLVVENNTYGTSGLTWVTFTPWDVHPRDSSTTYVYNTGAGTVGISNLGGPPFFEAGLHLPEGAVVSVIELAACNPSAVNLVASFRAVLKTGAAISVPGSASSTAGSFCQVFSSAAFTPWTVNNDTTYYTVELNFNSSTQPSPVLNSVRVGYKLQISPDPATATFADVPVGHPFHRFVEALVAAGITAGCGGGNYCPDAPVTRGQMAVFLSAALGLHWAP
jgi:hypothetical protein